MPIRIHKTTHITNLLSNRKPFKINIKQLGLNKKYHFIDMLISLPFLTSTIKTAQVNIISMTQTDCSNQRPIHVYKVACKN